MDPYRRASNTMVKRSCEPIAAGPAGVREYATVRDLAKAGSHNEYYLGRILASPALTQDRRSHSRR